MWGNSLFARQPHHSLDCIVNRAGFYSAGHRDPPPPSWGCPKMPGRAVESGRHKGRVLITSAAAKMLRNARVEVLNMQREAAAVANLEPTLQEMVGVADYMNNLEATFTLGMLFPLIGALCASVYATIVYSNYHIYQMPDPAVNRYLWFTISPLQNQTRLVTEVAEPFASACNLAYLVAGSGFFFLQFFSGAPLPEQTYGVAVFLLLLGAASGAFHMDASQTGTWQHHADRFGMYCLFSYLASVMLNGLFHAIKGSPASPRSACSVLTNLLGCFCAVFFLVQQEVC